MGNGYPADMLPMGDEPLQEARYEDDPNPPQVIQPRFTTKDSGERQDFDTGARRDVQDGKPRFDLIPTSSLTRLADLYAAGAEKYGDNNWQKGMPISRCYASAFRHLVQWAEGDRTEDHAAAVAWNMFAIMHYEDNMPELNDMEWAK